EFFSAFADTFPVLHVAVNVLILAVFALYASASVSLGWKSSNLTNRGVVACGLYRFVRHPAYVCKNAAWWLSASPALFGAFQTSFTFGCWCLFSLSCWTAIYALRAITEERHLLRVDTGYAAYRQAVPYRFIPFIL
ncbi:MAG: isoprenylcysteine carboxylmethyltransferase family protein, partial [Formivibrio sp.]|nr:isoprenylcysteine carboxylmethyltransferase family protein [Formivibrio sp.]